MIAIRDRDINMLTIGGSAPLDASERSAWSHWSAPHDVAVIGIERPKDAALLAKADYIAQEIRSCSSKVEIRAAGYRTIRVWSRKSYAGYCPGVNPCSLFAHFMYPVFKSTP